MWGRIRMMVTGPIHDNESLSREGLLNNYNERIENLWDMKFKLENLCIYIMFIFFSYYIVFFFYHFVFKILYRLIYIYFIYIILIYSYIRIVFILLFISYHIFYRILIFFHFIFVSYNRIISNITISNEIEK